MISGGYTKLFSSLIGSNLWRQDSKTLKIVWITMLAMADKNGCVMTSIPGLADFAKVTMEECLEALKILKSPDEYSRTPDNEGRRIEEIPGGWRILNFLKYRDTMDVDDRRAYNRAKQREYRANKKARQAPATLPGQAEYDVAERNGATQEQLDEIVTRHLPPAT